MSGVYRVAGKEGFGSYEVDFDTWTFTRVDKPAENLLIPGFVDIHIHGAFGIDFMTASRSDLLVLCDKLEALGYETFLPTTVTASAADVLRALENLPEHPMIGGFHLEGPFISPAYPGAQPPSFIASPPSPGSEWDAVLDHPQLKLVTLAPELPGALDLIRRLQKRHVVVSMGHTNATYEEANQGFLHGASHATHTFNAMRPFHHREAGMTGYALLGGALYSELIYDRLHVSPTSAQLLLRIKALPLVVAVSDSTMATGMPPGEEITMWGLRCRTGVKEVRLEDGTLAGSAITLFDAFRNLAADFGEETAISLCCRNPRESMNWIGKPRVCLELDKHYEIVGRKARV